MRGAQQAGEWQSSRTTQQERSPRAWALLQELTAACDIERPLSKEDRVRLEAHRDAVQRFIDVGGEATEEQIAKFRRDAGLPEAVRA